MVELIAENGKTARRTDMASARDRKDKLDMKALGTTDSNSVEFMFGQMVTVLRANGSVAVDMDSVLNTEENGRTKVNGKKGLKLGTEYRNHKVELVMKEAGLLVCRKVMESKFTLTEDITMDSGKQECALGMLYEVVKLNEKVVPRGITSVASLDKQLWITLNLMVYFLIVVRTLELFHRTKRPPHRLLISSPHLQDHPVIQRMLVKQDQ